MREEQRSAHWRSERQANAIIDLPVAKRRAVFPAFAVGPHVDRVGGRTRAEHEGHQCLVPAAELQRHAEALRFTPVPQKAVGFRTVAGPVDAPPQLVDPPRQRRRACLQILPGRDEAHHQEGGLDDVAAIVARREGDGGAAAAVHPVRKGATVAGCCLEEAADRGNALHQVASRQETSLCTRDHRHDAEAGAAGRHRVHHVTTAGPLARHAAGRMGEIGEIAQRFPLHPVEQQVGAHRSHVTVRHCVSRALGPTMMMKSPGSQPHAMFPSAGP